jgi:hypothetical protein
MIILIGAKGTMIRKRRKKRRKFSLIPGNLRKCYSWIPPPGKDSVKLNDRFHNIFFTLPLISFIY